MRGKNVTATLWWVMWWGPQEGQIQRGESWEANGRETHWVSGGGGGGEHCPGTSPSSHYGRARVCGWASQCDGCFRGNGRTGPKMQCIISDQTNSVHSSQLRSVSLENKKGLNTVCARVCVCAWRGVMGRYGSWRHFRVNWHDNFRGSQTGFLWPTNEHLNGQSTRRLIEFMNIVRDLLHCWLQVWKTWIKNYHQLAFSLLSLQFLRS